MDRPEPPVIRYERDDAHELWAIADVPVGIDRVPFRVPLGAGDGDDRNPGGLLQMPVVILPGHASTGLVLAAAFRAGAAAVREVLPEGRTLLFAAEGGADALVVNDGNGRSMNVVRVLGGRPLPALPSAEPAAIRTFLDGCHVDLDIAVPVVHDRQRGAVRASLEPLRLEDLHHLVEVDPTTGLDAAGIGLEASDEPALWAAAAGLLAGRLAAGRRRFLTGRS